MSNPILDAALKWLEAGCAVVPTRQDGTKGPAVDWGVIYRGEQPPPDEAQLRQWFGAQQRPGFGVITGHVSGELELFELEARAMPLLGHLGSLLDAAGQWGLLGQLLGSYAEATPNGGLHMFYRVADAPALGNVKLAESDGTDDPRGLGKPQTLVETRGEGGFCVVAPSSGPTHPTGRAWVALDGADPRRIIAITAAQRQTLHDCARLLDAKPHRVHEERQPAAEPRAPRPDGSTTPGDDYAARTPWDEILTGWTRLWTHNDITYWRRPGKGDGVSATTNALGTDRLKVHSTSTEFDSDTSYSKLGAYALLNHGNDFAAAVRHLGRQGYGDQAKAQQRTDDPGALIAPQQPTGRHLSVVQTDGTLALAPQPEAKPITLTDHGNAMRLIDAHGQELRYAPSRGAWLRWDGARWAWCEDDAEAVQCAVRTIMAMGAQDEAALKWRHRSLGHDPLQAMVKMARRDPRIRVAADQLDARPDELNTPAGIVDLRTGQLSPCIPEAHHTKVTGVPMAPAAAPAPARWLQFLADTFGGDDELAGYVQRLAGMACSGLITAHVLPFLHGPGGNGKSVFLDVLLAVLGDYATSAPAGFLMVGQQQHETEVARLAGVRLVICSEVNQSARFDEAKVKLLTGGDRLTARFMHRDHFTFVPSHTLMLMGNSQPRVEAGGESFWRRLRLLPFTRTVPPERRVEGLARLLVADEGPQILRWLVEGSVASYAHGLREPASVLAATAEYALEEDSLARFVQDMCVLGGAPLVKANTSHVRSAYAAWCREQGEQELSLQTFGREIRSRFGVQQIRSHGARYYVGLALVTQQADEREPDRRHPDA